MSTRSNSGGATYFIETVDYLEGISYRLDQRCFVVIKGDFQYLIREIAALAFALGEVS